jgi:hypothetical protein
MNWWQKGFATLTLALAGLAQAAVLNGDQVQITLSSPNGIAGDSTPISLVDLKTVGAGPEIAVGDGSNIGGFMLPGEFIDLNNLSIQLRIGTGAVNLLGQQNPGYAAGAIYLFESLNVAGETIVGASITGNSGFSNFSASWLNFLSPNSLSLDIGSMLFTGGAADIDTFGDITITLQTRPNGGNDVPEPGALLLAFAALGAWRVGAGRRRLG